MSLGLAFILFVPVFLAINVLAAIPGRDDLRQALKVGVRHFAIWSAVLIGAAIVLDLLILFLKGTHPLF